MNEYTDKTLAQRCEKERENKMNTTRLQTALNKLKLAKEQNDFPRHEVWIPAPEKEAAKLLGIRWNGDVAQFQFAAPLNGLEKHPCAKYLPSNFVQLKGQIPYDQRTEFKELGVVTHKVDGKWQNYVMMDDAYADLLAGLTELELL